MPVIRRRRFRNQPRLIQRPEHLLWQRALLHILQIPLELLFTAHADKNPIIPTVLDIQRRMVREPPESRLEKREVVLLDDGLDDAQSLERRVLEVALAVHAGQATVFPFGVAGEGSLLAADVYACRIDLVVAGALECVEYLVVGW